MQLADRLLMTECVDVCAAALAQVSLVQVAVSLTDFVHDEHTAESTAAPTQAFVVLQNSHCVS